MSDESPRDESPASNAPAEEHPAADEPTAAAEAAPTPPPPPGEPPARRGIWVSRGVAFVAGAVVAVLVLFFGGFAIGRVTSGGGDNEGRERTEREFPRRDGRGNEGRGNEGRGNEGRGNEGGGARPTSGVFLGVATRDATGDVKGAEVVRVADGSPAAQAGLQDGDIVTAVDGSAVTNASDLAQQVHSHKSGDQVTITYSRGGNSTQAQVTLGNRSATGTPSA